MTYTAEDYARHDLSASCERAEQTSHLFEGGEPRPGLTVAEAIADACQVGYGGHYSELLDDEETFLRDLAEHLAPLYQQGEQAMFEELCSMRDDYCSWLRFVTDIAKAQWEGTSYKEAPVG